MKIADFSIKHPVVISIILVALTLFGLMGGMSMSQEFFAQIDMPELVVLTTYPGAGAQDIEREISSVIEDSVSSISGISTITSTSYNSFSLVNVQFNYDEDVTKKIGDMREKINEAKENLPESASNPQIIQFSTSQLPIFTFSIESNLEKEILDDFIKNIVIPRLSRIKGVAQCTLQGTTEQEVQVSLRHEDLAASGLDVLTVFQLIQANNQTVPSGQVRFQGEVLNLRLNGQYTTIDDLRNLVIGAKDDVLIRLADIADVSLLQQKHDMYVTQADEQIQIVNILKQQGSDTVKIAAEIQSVLKALQAESNNLVAFTVINDDSYNISLAINSLRDSALLGATLAVFVIFLFLHNIRSTVIIAISLPCSILFAFCLMVIKGQGINLMTLAGFTVAVGMIVDNSIVVLENIYRHYVLTNDAKKAASIGTSEVGGSIIASTATTLVVFIPLLFLQGLTGKILSDVALTIIWTIGSSMIASLVVVPFLSAYLLRPLAVYPQSKKSRVIERIDFVYGKIEWFYTLLLKKSLNNRAFVLFFAVFLLIMSVLSAGMLGFEFLTETDMNEIIIKANFPSTYSLEQTRDTMKEVDVFARSIIPEIETSSFSSGTDSAFGFTKQSNKGYARIKLIPASKRNRDIFAIISQLRRELQSTFVGAELTVENGGLGQLLSMATGGSGFIVELYGNNLQNLYESAQKIAQVMESDEAVDAVAISMNFDTREIVSTVQQDIAGTLGIQTQEIAILTRILFSGLEAGTYRSEDRSYPISVKSDLANSTIAQNVFDNIYVNSATGAHVPLSTVVDMKVNNSVNYITNQNGSRTVRIQAQLNNPDLRGLQNRVLPQIELLQLPAGVEWNIAGSAASMLESFASLIMLMGISTFLVYMVMVIQFERFIQPLIVMVSIPFAFIGIVLSLTLFNTTLSLLSMLGIITLIGTVVNTAIVLIDYINLLRNSYKMNLYDALINGCTNRLRPVLMSVLTTVIGLVPMMFAIGEGSGLTAPLAQAIFGGMLSSTFVTLIFIPVLYAITEQNDEKKRLARELVNNE